MISARRDVAQLGRALRSGRRGRGFESRHPDQSNRSAGRHRGRPAVSHSLERADQVLETALMWLGFGLCHQLPERSLFGGVYQVPVCARDEGIYIGFVVALLLMAFFERGGRRSSGSPPWWVLLTLVGFLVVMALDGLSSYAGLRATSNEIRLMTGLMAGVAISVFTVPLVNSQLWRSAGTGQRAWTTLGVRGSARRDGPDVRDRHAGSSRFLESFTPSSSRWRSSRRSRRCCSSSCVCCRRSSSRRTGSGTLGSRYSSRLRLPSFCSQPPRLCVCTCCGL